MTLFSILRLQSRLIHLFTNQLFQTRFFRLIEQSGEKRITTKMSDEAPPPYPGPKKEEESTATPSGQNGEAKKTEEPFDNSKLPPPPPYSGSLIWISVQIFCSDVKLKTSLFSLVRIVSLFFWKKNASLWYRFLILAKIKRTNKLSSF